MNVGHDLSLNRIIIFVYYCWEEKMKYREKYWRFLVEEELVVQIYIKEKERK